MSFIQKLFNARRWLALCVLVTASLLAGIAFLSPQQIPVVVYKLALALLAGLAGYWLDRVLFPYADPAGYLVDDWKQSPDADGGECADYPIVQGCTGAFSAAMLRRAVLVAAVIIGVCLGL